MSDNNNTPTPKKWEEELGKIYTSRMNNEEKKLAIWLTFKQAISQEKEKWEKERSEEDNYQCVDCSEWNVKSPLTQCSECRRQD